MKMFDQIQTQYIETSDILASAIPLVSELEYISLDI